MRPLPGDRSRGTARLLAAVLAAAPLVARAQEPAPGAGGVLRITAEPPRLLLGRDAGAELRIQAPPEVEELAVLPSAGRVEGVRRLSGGGFTARYLPPPDRAPQVAILAALGRTARGAVDGWLAIPLSGQGEARVRTAPGAEITLDIAGRAFGPRRADAQGVAVIPVVVPPGVTEAHHGFRPVDLKVPERPLLHAVADRSAVRADRAEQVRVYAYVVAPHGAARRGDVPVLEPSRGSVQVAAREPGAFVATWSLPPGAVGTDRLVVRLPGSAVSRAELRLEAVPARGPFVAQPGPAPAPARREVALLAGGGAVFDLRGRFVAPRLGLAVELPGPLAATWRVEAEGLGYGREPPGPSGADARVRAGVLLGGISLRREARGGPALWASLCAGALLARSSSAGAAAETGFAPAARASLGLGWRAGVATPFLEASVLAAGRSPAGAFAAAGLSAGVRFDWR